MNSEEPVQLIVFGRTRNPVLEELRDSVPGPPPVEDDVSELVQATSCVHAGFLFSAKGLPALKQICRFVLSAEEYCGGWREFAANLGLDPVAVECMRNSGDLTHVCELVLKVFAQEEDASLDRVVSSLHQMNRVDAICQCKSPLMDLVDFVLKDNDPSHIITAGEGQRSLITPSYLPKVSITFRNLNPLQGLQTSSQPQRINIERQREGYQEDAVNRDNAQLQNQIQEYAYLVMLTFANDGAEAAKRIANVFRQTYNSDGNRVGVVILQEHSFRVNAYGSQYVLGFLNDVDYVVPIVTKGYVDAVLKHDDTIVDEQQPSCLDHKYARYVYQQLQTEYLSRHCVNARVRPVIPDDYIMRALHQFIMADALFQSWCAESDVADLANRLL